MEEPQRCLVFLSIYMPSFEGEWDRRQKSYFETLLRAEVIPVLRRQRLLIDTHALEMGPSGGSLNPTKVAIQTQPSSILYWAMIPHTCVTEYKGALAVFFAGSK